MEFDCAWLLAAEIKQSLQVKDRLLVRPNPLLVGVFPIRQRSANLIFERIKALANCSPLRVDRSRLGFQLRDKVLAHLIKGGLGPSNLGGQGSHGHAAEWRLNIRLD